MSYDPKWHGTLDDLPDNMEDLVRRHDTDIIVFEYSARKEEVNKLVFELPGGDNGTYIWEPLSTWQKIFDSTGKSNDLMKLYDGIGRKYLTGN